MAKVIRKRWIAEQTSGLPRRDRRSCEYEAYVPDTLVERDFILSGEVAADVADAEAALARFETEATTLTDTEALSRLLLRAEAVASSQIEGLEVGPRRLLRAEAREGSAPRDVTAEAVLGNVRAMQEAIRMAAHQDVLSVDELLRVHARLMEGTRLQAEAGRIREAQNWIGGSAYDPCSAEFVPPPPGHVPGLLEDLCVFCSEDRLPAVAQAAIAHAQFETIHPFMDGNGRVGRALTHMVMTRRGLVGRVLAPVSLILATWSEDYIAGLTAYRYRGPSTGEAAEEGIGRWVGLFATACRRAVEDAEVFERRMAEIQRGWRRELGRIRADSSVDLLLAVIPGSPLLTVRTAAELIDRSLPAANQAVSRLEDAGVLRQITVGKRNRAFEAPDVIDAFTDLERRPASPVGGTRVEPPGRPVPRRR